MTREELQRLYGECVSRAFRAEQLAGLVHGVESFLAEPDPTVEIAYLRAALCDVKAERDAAQAEANRLKERATGPVVAGQPGSDGPVSAAEMAAAMYPESDITYGYQAVREAYEYGYTAAESRVPGMLSMKWDGGRCAVLDADQRIVGYLPPGRQAAGTAASALREAAEDYHLKVRGIVSSDLVHSFFLARADRIESGAES